MKVQLIIIIIGLFINNTLNGKGEKKTLTNTTYFGSFKNSLKHGFGREETIEHIYEGEYENDKKQGTGKLSYKTINDVYSGEFKDNCITGYGLYNWANGDSFKGTFLNGKMHGKGTYTWPDGGEYVGEYYDNLKEGFGIFKWPSGKVYEGKFSNGKPHGNGIMKISDEKFDVEFVEGKLAKKSKMEIQRSVRGSGIVVNPKESNSKKDSSKLNLNTPSTNGSMNLLNLKNISPRSLGNSEIRSSRSNFKNY
jgi:hypothetical protein